MLIVGVNLTLDVNLISKCGIYCGACYVYRSFKDGGRLLETIAEQLGVPKDEIRCGGCLGSAENLWLNCRKCQISACLKEKGLVFCYECPQFETYSCEKYEKLRKFCSERGEDVKEALRRIKAGEARKWLEEQDKKWRCPACGGSIYWTEETCHHCGRLIGGH